MGGRCRCDGKHCPVTGKHQRTEIDAWRKACKTSNKTQLDYHAYLCEHCGAWHIGHWHKAKRRVMITA